MMQVDCKSQIIVFWGSLPWNVAFSSLGQPQKQDSPKEVTEEGIVMLVKPEQYSYLYIVLYQRFMH